MSHREEDLEKTCAHKTLYMQPTCNISTLVRGKVLCSCTHYPGIYLGGSLGVHVNIDHRTRFTNHFLVNICSQCSLVPRPPQAFIACSIRSGIYTASGKSLGRPGYEAIASVCCGNISSSCCSVKKDVAMGFYTLTFTFMLSSLPCLHTFWHAIPTSSFIFNVFYSLYIYMVSEHTYDTGKHAHRSVHIQVSMHTGACTYR